MDNVAKLLQGVKERAMENNDSKSKYRGWDQLCGEKLTIYYQMLQKIDTMSIQESLPGERTQHTLPGALLLLLAGRTRTGWHSNAVIRCYRNFLSLCFVMDICNFVRFDTGGISDVE